MCDHESWLHVGEDLQYEVLLSIAMLKLFKPLLLRAHRAVARCRAGSGCQIPGLPTLRSHDLQHQVIVEGKNNVDRGLEIAVPFLSHGQCCNHVKTNQNMRKKQRIF